MIPLSILELARVTEDVGPGQAINNARDLAGHAEKFGYHRIWVAEHHNMPGIASAATSIVLAHIAGGTSTIRVGAGGIMLPNHAPYIIAEQFGTLERLFPGRIDLGLGRAPGTDQMTLRALRRSPEASDSFPQDVLELQAYLAPAGREQRIQAVPAAHRCAAVDSRLKRFRGDARGRTGATLCLRLALRAGHAVAGAGDLSPPLQALPPAGPAQTMVGVNVIAAETDAQAHRLATTQQMSFTNMFRGNRGLSQPPIDDIETYWTPMEKAQAMRMLARSVIGSPETVRAGLEALVQETGADELIIVSDVYHHEERLHSIRLIAEAVGLKPA